MVAKQATDRRCCGSTVLPDVGQITWPLVFKTYAAAMWTLFLAVLPPKIATAIRRWRGAAIARTARIGWLSLVDVDDLTMERDARIGMFAVVRARRLAMGRAAAIRSLALVSTHTVELGEAVHIAPTAVIFASPSSAKAKFIAGDHSRIFPLCWIEPGEGVRLGKHVGIGGHGLIFTHGSWSDYLAGGPIAYAPVTIEDRVWLPWRVTVQAGVTIGADAVVMSGSVVTRSIPPNSLAGGAPAKVIREPAMSELEAAERRARAEEIAAAFSSETGGRVVIDAASAASPGDVLLALDGSIEVAELVERRVAVVDYPNGTFYAAGQSPADSFADFAQRYGIRLYRR